MDQITHDVRGSQWLEIITQCQNRPEGTTAKQWMADNGISEKSYYYWLRKFRKQACSQMTETSTAISVGNEISFAEVSISPKHKIFIFLWNNYPSKIILASFINYKLCIFMYF